MTFFAVSVLVLNFVLWGVLLLKFKHHFSTDSIIEKTQNKINQLINELNNNTEMDISLINESTKRLKNFLSDAELRMKDFEDATNRLRDMIAQADYIIRNSEKTSFIYQDEHFSSNGDSNNKVNTSNMNSIQNPFSSNKSVRKDFLNKNINSYVKNSKSNIDPESSYKILNQQATLFDNEEKSILKDEINVTSQGAAYKEVPLIITKVIEDKPVTIASKKNNLNLDVQKLYNQGYSIEQIATELSCSVTEVQFIIDMTN